MRITEIRYDRKIQTRQYESATFGATALLSELDDLATAVDQLKMLVDDAVAEPVQMEIPVKGEPKKEAKEEVKEEPKKEEVKEEEPKKEEVKEEVKEEKPKKKTVKKKAVKKVKGTMYDRDLEAHKKELGSYLNEYYPNWTDDASKASKVSLAMDKQVLLYDTKGDIAQDFITAVMDGMA